MTSRPVGQEGRCSLVVNKSFSQKTLSFRGTKLWKEIDNDIKSTHWVSFKKAYKHFLLQSY